ncbi:MAG: response regulator, partial [Kiritimatiellaceae bacterium]|nr:response regulator [Kiritimatiellaceae bacterium]
SVHAIVNDAVGILKNTIDKKISITVKTEASADEATGDSSGIQNAILNLGINASHAMPDGGSLQISTRNVSLDDTYCTISTFDLIPGDYIEIEIKDNGSGIAPQNLDRIYEPFFTTKKQGEGSGLGLAAVYGTVQDHHGAITVYSEKDTGTVFHLYLPCSEKKKPNTPSKSEVIMGKGTILLVDDEDALLAIGKMTLEHLGYQVLQASNGAEARDLFREKHREIDLVIMDMIMPVMNGKDAFLEMKKIDPDCKVIIASGFSKSENLDELRDAGLAGFILKPFRSVALSQLIAEQLAPTDTSSSA